MSTADLQAMGVTHINYTLKVHGNTTYVDCDAVSLNKVLSKAGPSSSAANIMFIGADNYNATLPLTNITPDNNTMIAFTQEDGLRDCLPNETSKYWVRNLTAIKVM